MKKLIVFLFLFSACDSEFSDWGVCGFCAWKNLPKPSKDHVQIWQSCKNIQYDYAEPANSKCLDVNRWCVFEKFSNVCGINSQGE